MTYEKAIKSEGYENCLTAIETEIKTIEGSFIRDNYFHWCVKTIEFDKALALGKHLDFFLISFARL